MHDRFTRLRRMGADLLNARSDDEEDDESEGDETTTTGGGDSHTVDGDSTQKAKRQ